MRIKIYGFNDKEPEEPEEPEEPGEPQAEFTEKTLLASTRGSIWEACVPKWRGVSQDKSAEYRYIRLERDDTSDPEWAAGLGFVEFKVLFDNGLPVDIPELWVDSYITSDDQGRELVSEIPAEGAETLYVVSDASHTKYADETLYFTAIAAVFRDDSIVNVYWAPGSLSRDGLWYDNANDNQERIIAPIEGVQKGDVVKTFVWNGYDSLKPLQSFVYEIR